VWEEPAGGPRPAGALVLVEGPCDALSLAECDVPAVALVGTAAPAWLPQAAAFRRVVVALDADAAGDRAAAGLMEALASFARSVERLRPPAGKDWNDALLADYGGLCDLLEGCGLVAAGAVLPAASSAPAPPDWGPLVLPSGAERR
jgi:Toprim-like